MNISIKNHELEVDINNYKKTTNQKQKKPIPELTQHILSFLIDNRIDATNEDLSNIKLVCTEWNNLTYILHPKSAIFKALVEKHFPIPSIKKLNSPLEIIHFLNIPLIREFMIKFNIKYIKNFVNNLAEGLLLYNKKMDNFQIPNRYEFTRSNNLISELIFNRNEDLALKCLPLLNENSKAYLDDLLATVSYNNSIKVAHRGNEYLTVCKL